MTLKTLFKKKGIEYIEKDIEVEENRLELFEKYKVQMVPVTVFDDEPIVGLNLPVIMKKISS